MRRPLVLSLALSALAPAVAGAQACMGRPEARHRIGSVGGHFTDAFVRRSIGYAARAGTSSAQYTFTDPSLWARPLRHRAYTIAISRDLWRRDSAAVDAQAPAARRATGNRWCFTTGLRERREPVPTGMIDAKGQRVLDQDRTYGHTRVHAGLGWGRTIGSRDFAIQPFAQAGAALDFETLDLPDDDHTSRIRPAGFTQVGLGIGGEQMHATFAVAYLPGLPQYSLLNRHNWLQLTVNIGVRLDQFIK